VPRGLTLRRHLDKSLGVPLILALAQLRHRQKKPEEIHKIVVLQNPTIGDTVLMTGPLQDLAYAFPDATITLIPGPDNSAICEFVPAITDYLIRDYSRPLNFLSSLRSKTFDLLVDFGTWPRINAIYSGLARTKFTVGFQTPGQMRHFAYDATVIHRNDVHELVNQRALVEYITDRPGIHSPRLTNVSISTQLIPQLRAPYVIMHAWASGSGKRFKEWPPEHWASLAALLHERSLSVVLTGNAADTQDGEALAAQIRGRVGEISLENLTGKLTFRELLPILAGAEAVVSVNTGLMHVAAALGVRTVGLHGPTNPLRWGPYGSRCAAPTPDRGSHSYLNLGFEFPKTAEYSMQHLMPKVVLSALIELGLT
jgi:heptosyltransferase III